MRHNLTKIYSHKTQNLNKLCFIFKHEAIYLNNSQDHTFMYRALILRNSFNSWGVLAVLNLLVQFNFSFEKGKKIISITQNKNKKVTKKLQELLQQGKLNLKLQKPTVTNNLQLDSIRLCLNLQFEHRTKATIYLIFFHFYCNKIKKNSHFQTIL